MGFPFIFTSPVICNFPRFRKFNIFKILGIGRREVSTHSPMLGNLLNPKGSHGQGDAFLRLFVSMLGIADFDTASARLELEYYIGRVTEKSGGRIDIVILDKDGNAIFIENKIGAGDQKKQLQRYRQRKPLYLIRKMHGSFHRHLPQTLCY